MKPIDRRHNQPKVELHHTHLPADTKQELHRQLSCQSQQLTACIRMQKKETSQPSGETHYW